MVVEDHPIVMEGVKAVLQRLPEVTVVSTATTGAEALTAAAASDPAVVLLDLEIPPPAGAELIQALAEVCSARVLIMTVIDDDDRLVECMRAGASGYLLKGTPIDEVLHAIKLVHQGEVSLTPALTRRLVTRLAVGEPVKPEKPAAQPTLTSREREVLTYVMRGHTNRQIASRMFLSPRTVKAHLATAFEKLEVHDRTAAVSVAIARGLIELDGPDGRSTGTS
ncbi:LuxR C-terminal-related transcriptional regulator [Pseudonocardia hispaniensis]|uniref:LuxR C-terminal-related transcriptional regulator n=1 Tax=Pseudonocardia hispaniensis TaxID=904933 RepID=A0ABW1J437_9PSEU